MPIECGKLVSGLKCCCSPSCCGALGTVCGELETHCCLMFYLFFFLLSAQQRIISHPLAMPFPTLMSTLNCKRHCSALTSQSCGMNAVSQGYYLFSSLIWQKTPTHCEVTLYFHRIINSSLEYHLTRMKFWKVTVTIQLLACELCYSFPSIQ